MPRSSLRPHHPRARILSEMCAEFGIEPVSDGFDADQVEVTGAVSAADGVEEGDIYVAAPRWVDAPGEAFATAVERGASCILTDASLAPYAEGLDVPVLVVEDARLALGHIAQWVYRTDPKTPRLIGVTGSLGKTSIVYLLDNLLDALGVKTGMSTNRQRHVGEERMDAGGLAPEADELHAMLARMREVGVHVAAVELTDEAVSEHHIAGLYFDVVGYPDAGTALEGGAAARFEASVQLFAPEHAQRGVVNVDGEMGRRLVEETRIPVTTIASAAGEGADWWVESEPLDEGIRFTMHGPEDRELRSWTSQEGPYAAINAGSAVLMLDSAGWDVEQIQAALDRVDGIHLAAEGSAAPESRGSA
ncbi:Mur ligase family protein [Gulosibacter sp. 10]|uniref:Mur ligase family protein n=1 Tax=Gulosibacter sp. 10 TaxID=1255570 RepID=UPI00097F61B2|nr:Mur ligase family protein [Gulosibacter sp. 10]SJM65468.1 UDP-N-acetylmuramoylalanyl-D-glutamate--2,6-diaminopimelate ligase [Gulosibacter sp. 10]